MLLAAGKAKRRHEDHDGALGAGEGCLPAAVDDGTDQVADGAVHAAAFGAVVATGAAAVDNAWWSW